MSDFNVWSYIAKLGVQVRGPGDPFFEDGDRLCKVSEPVTLTIEDVEEFLHKDYQEFPCQVPGCTAKFNQLYDSELHYNAAHKHSCSVCKKSLPSYHLLELHIQESHDSFFAVLAEKKPSYQCFLPTCTEKFWNSGERRDHVISKHDFPPDFRFDNAKRNPRKKSSRSGDKKGTSVGQQGNQDRKPIKQQHGAASGSTAHLPTAAIGASSGGFVNGSAAAAVKDTKVDGMEVIEGSGDEVNVRKLSGQGLITSDGNRRPTAEDNSSGRSKSRMEVDGEEEETAAVVLRRTTPARRPISLARMGERRSSVQVDAVMSPDPLPDPSHSANGGLVKHSFHATSPDVSLNPSTASSTSPPPLRKHSRPSPVRPGGACGGISLARLGSPRKELGPTRDGSRSRIHRPDSGASPRSSQTEARAPRFESHNSPRTPRLESYNSQRTPRLDSYHPPRTPRLESQAPRSLNVSSPHDKGPESPSTTPRKSMIPVRSNSCKAPRNFSFGAGVPKTFNRPKSRHWYQSQQGLNTSNTNIHNATDMTDMRDVLNSIHS